MSIALVTGASSGIGAAFCALLAEKGHDLIVTARRADRLEALARTTRGGVEITAADLSTDEGISAIEARLRRGDVDVLVHAAGFGTAGPFAESDVAGQMAMVRVHVEACLRLTHAALPGMLARRRGAIVHLASIGAFMVGPGNVTYSATKAFVVSFARSLHAELAGSGVAVQALCPGFTHTEFYATAEYSGMDVQRIAPRWLWGRAEDVARRSIDALGRGPVLVPRWRDRLVIALGSVPFIARAALRRTRRASPNVTRKRCA